MLVALLMAFFLGGAGSGGGILTRTMLEDIDVRLQQEISDPARAKKVAGEVAGLRDELKRFEKTFAESGKALTKTYEDHAAGAVTIQAELDALDSAWEAAHSRALDHRFAIKENMTREEWGKVFGGR